MSDQPTPRTDEKVFLLSDAHLYVVPAYLARQLERELAEAKNWREVAEGMTKWKDDLLRERDQWREVAEGLHKIVEEYWEPDWESTPENKRNVLDLYDKLKEQQ